MRSTLIWFAIGFAAALLLALPAKAWAVIGLFVAAAIFAVGLWGVFQIIRGMVREWRRVR
jgi:mannose/fructose/N-acetylgalactosamine-specific phosphotransferase system component IIC